MDIQSIARFRYLVHAPGIVGATVAVVPAIAYTLWSDGARLSTVIGYTALVLVFILTSLYRLYRWEQRTTTVTVSEIAQRGYELLWLAPVGALLMALLLRA